MPGWAPPAPAPAAAAPTKRRIHLSYGNRQSTIAFFPPVSCLHVSSPARAHCCMTPCATQVCAITITHLHHHSNIAWLMPLYPSLPCTSNQSTRAGWSPCPGSNTPDWCWHPSRPCATQLLFHLLQTVYVHGGAGHWRRIEVNICLSVWCRFLRTVPGGALNST